MKNKPKPKKAAVKAVKKPATKKKSAAKKKPPINIFLLTTSREVQGLKMAAFVVAEQMQQTKSMLPAIGSPANRGLMRLASAGAITIPKQKKLKK